MPHVGEIVESVDVDSSDFDFVTRPCCINQVIDHIYLLLSRHTTRRHSAGRLLNGQLLVVPVEGGLLVEGVGAGSVAADADAEVLAGILLRVVESWSLKISAHTAEVHFFELWENTCALSNYASEFDQGI